MVLLEFPHKTMTFNWMDCPEAKPCKQEIRSNTLQTIRHLIGCCPDTAGHALFKHLILKFRLLPHHTAQQSDNGKSHPLKHHTLTTTSNYSTGVHYVVTGALKNSIVHACWVIQSSDRAPFVTGSCVDTTYEISFSIVVHHFKKSCGSLKRQSNI